MAQTGIVCTGGPSSDEAGTLKSMIDAGMDVVRLNFSHGSHAEHQKRIDAVRELNREYGLDVKILQDLEGFRLRIGSLRDREGRVVELKANQVVFLSNRAENSEHETIRLDYRGSLQAIPAGSSIVS